MVTLLCTSNTPLLTFRLSVVALPLSWKFVKPTSEVVPYCPGLPTEIAAEPVGLIVDASAVESAVPVKVVVMFVKVVIVPVVAYVPFAFVEPVRVNVADPLANPEDSKVKVFVPAANPLKV